MKKLSVFSSIVCLVMATGLASIANAENYVDKSVPSDDLIVKNLFVKEYPRTNTIVGKVKVNGSYVFYFNSDPKHPQNVQKVTVEKLDNDIWVMNGGVIVQK